VIKNINLYSRERYKGHHGSWSQAQASASSIFTQALSMYQEIGSIISPPCLYVDYCSWSQAQASASSIFTQALSKNQEIGSIISPSFLSFC
jgi:hypothetical protein